LALKKYQKDFILHLINSGALKFGEFKLKSGRISPYFVNITLAISDGESAAKTADAYINAIMDKVKTNFDFLHGPAYKGIPLASLIAIKLWEKHGISIRWGYDRKELKDYGDLAEEVIVGDLRDGDVVLIVDDVITTGLTKIENWNKLRKIRSVKPKGILIAVDRQELSIEEKNRLEQLGLVIYSIVKITDIFNFLFRREIGGKMYVDENIKKSFDSYFKKYGVVG